MTKLGPDRDANLGAIQKHVLLALSTRGASTATDWTAWFPFEPWQARGAIASLERRGLVDVVGRRARARVYGLSARGWGVVRRLTEETCATCGCEPFFSDTNPRPATAENCDGDCVCHEEPA